MSGSLGVRQAGRAVEQTLNILPMPMWVVRDDAQVDFANAAGRQLALDGTWVREHKGRLTRIGEWGPQAVRTLLHPRAAGAGPALAVALDAKGFLQRGLLRVIPLTETVLYAAAWPSARTLLMLDLPAPRDADALWQWHVADRFGLTPVQARILEALGRGLSVNEIAASRGIKVGTVRAHVHELLAKTGRSKQSGLVRLALGR